MALQYNVSQLLKSDIGDTRWYEFESSVPIDLGDATATDIKGEVKFTLTNFGILAAIRAAANLCLTCARCLEPFTQPTEVSFDEEYQPTIDISTGMPSGVPKSDTAFRVSQSHTIDLTEAFRQNLVVAVDIIPLCSADCQGLCPTCGVNRNIEQCLCPPEEEASPFAVLQGLLTEAQSER